MISVFYPGASFEHQCWRRERQYHGDSSILRSLATPEILSGSI